MLIILVSTIFYNIYIRVEDNRLDIRVVNVRLGLIFFLFYFYFLFLFSLFLILNLDKKV